MRVPEKRTIYDNYDLWNQYEADAREYLEGNGNTDPSESEIWDEVYTMDEENWADEKEQLEKFFNDGSTWLLTGVIELWRGKYPGGFLFHTFEEMWTKATKDCDYFHLYDENGHFYIKCSHHDGTNFYEIKRLTKKGEIYYDNWNYGTRPDTRTEQQVHKKLMECYSTLPHYANKVWGCPKVSYEKKVEAS